MFYRNITLPQSVAKKTSLIAQMLVWILLLVTFCIALFNLLGILALPGSPGYAGSFESLFFFGTISLLILSLSLFLSSIVKSKRFLKYLRIALLLPVGLILIRLLVSLIYGVYYTLVFSDIVILPGRIFFFSILFSFLILFILLLRKSWYHNILIFIGCVIFLSSVLFMAYFLSIGLRSNYDTDPAIKHLFKIEASQGEYLLGFPVPTLYILYSITLITLGFLKKTDSSEIWKKILRYEIGLGAVLFILWGVVLWI